MSPYTKTCPTCQSILIFAWNDTKHTEIWLCPKDLTRVRQSWEEGILRIQLANEIRHEPDY